jgi:hypothetical protein
MSKIKAIKGYAVVDIETGDFAAMPIFNEKDIIYAPSVFGNRTYANKRRSWIVAKKLYKVIPVLISPIITKPKK